MIWLFKYTRHWWNTDYVDGWTLSKLRTWTLIWTFILLFIRILLAILVMGAGNHKIKTNQPHSLSNQYNKAVRNDEYFIDPEFSIDGSSEQRGEYEGFTLLA